MHTEVKEVTVRGYNKPRYGLKSKTRKWFFYHYATETAAQQVQNKIEATWDDTVEAVNFSHNIPICSASHKAGG